MTPDNLATWFSQVQPMVVDVMLPKVQVTSLFDLSEPLNNLGLQTIMTEKADLTNMSQDVDREPLRLSKFLHESQITLHEQADIPQQTVPQAQARFYVDRPFVFLVWNVQSGTPLVIGCVTDPR